MARIKAQTIGKDGTVVGNKKKEEEENRQKPEEKAKIPEDCGGRGMKGNDKSRDAPHWIRFRLWLLLLLLLQSSLYYYLFVYIHLIFLWPTDSFRLEPRTFFLRLFLLSFNLSQELPPFFLFIIFTMAEPTVFHHYTTPDDRSCIQ